MSVRVSFMRMCTVLLSVRAAVPIWTHSPLATRAADTSMLYKNVHPVVMGLDAFQAREGRWDTPVLVAGAHSSAPRLPVADKGTP